jgi:NitT/TauT family transport system permease protein
VSSSTVLAADLAAGWRLMRRRSSVPLMGALGLGSFIALWWLGGTSTRFIPPIGETLAGYPAFLGTDIWGDILASMSRVVMALLLALALGAAAAWVIATGGFWGRVVSKYVELALGLPSTIVALISLMIFKRSEAGVFLVVAIACFPFIAITLRQGLGAMGPQLAGMATVYRFGWFRTLRHVLVPHLVPYAMSSTRNEYAHAWRVVVLAEIFAVNSGVGQRFTQAFDRFLIDQVVFWLITFIILLLSTEYLILRPMEKLALRWRGDAK